MTGIIITGHGTFASGVISVLELLVGKPEGCQAVEFFPEDSMEVLTGKMEAAVKALENPDGCLILCDLAGGSPFNTAIRLAMEGQYRLQVVGGVNVPMVIEALMSRAAAGNIEELTQLAMKAGQEQLVQFQRPEMTDDDEYDE